MPLHKIDICTCSCLISAVDHLHTSLQSVRQATMSGLGIAPSCFSSNDAVQRTGRAICVWTPYLSEWLQSWLQSCSRAYKEAYEMLYTLCNNHAACINALCNVFYSLGWSAIVQSCLTHCNKHKSRHWDDQDKVNLLL